MTQQEELLALKHLVKKQQKQFAEKDEIIEKQNTQLDEQRNRIEKQQIQIENMIQALLHTRKKMFGPSTEATKQMEGQLFLFEEAQKLAEELHVGQKTIPSSQYLEHPEVLDQYLQWTESLPKECRLEHSHKKCLNQ